MREVRWPARGTQLVHEMQPTGFVPVTEEALAEIVRRIVAALHPEKIILFGSYAYGTPSSDSDVDLLVIMHTHDRPVDRYLAVSRLLRPRPFPLDILVKTPAGLPRDGCCMSDATDPQAWVARAEEDYTLARTALRRKVPLIYGVTFHAQPRHRSFLKGSPPFAMLRIIGSQTLQRPLRSCISAVCDV